MVIDESARKEQEMWHRMLRKTITIETRMVRYGTGFAFPVPIAFVSQKLLKPETKYKIYFEELGM